MKIVSRNPIVDEVFYNDEARKYCASLPLEHFMESTPTGIQRKITLASFDLISAERPDVHCFNELLIQYPVGDIRTLQRVVPDNLIVIHAGPVRAVGSFNVPFETAEPFLTMEYVSEGNERKDYVDNMRRYQDDLRVPYYLLFEPMKEQLLLFKLPGRKKAYVSVKPNPDDRLEIPELELEVARFDGWARYWFRGKLLPLPAEMAQELKSVRRQLQNARKEVQVEREAR
ncbi:MAG: Uma2 family endonuclease, partial [Fimbriiglobus sp.]